ncbi:MAG: acyloxyacyl hydrolase [Candidatus Coatesbacteria bacterium]|nr:MAG: acyloxyacyl hydrolase [Candidatus Coatesbacteria bacterium]
MTMVTSGYRTITIITASILGAVSVNAAGPLDAAHFTFGTGVYDFHEAKQALEFRVEYHPGWKLAWFRPFVGLSGTTKGSVYSYFGLLARVRITDRLTLIPSAAAGAYEKGNAKDLGHRLEFRTGGEISFRVYDGFRLGIAFHHISNASIGAENPGLELLVATYSVPLP